MSKEDVRFIRFKKGFGYFFNTEDYGALSEVGRNDGPGLAVFFIPEYSFIRGLNDDVQFFLFNKSRDVFGSQRGSSLAEVLILMTDPNKIAHGSCSFGAQRYKEECCVKRGAVCLLTVAIKFIIFVFFGMKTVKLMI
jgi:hypothetical protein